MTDRYNYWLLGDTKTCYRLLLAGFGIILLTFGAGVFTLLTPLGPVYDVLMMPTLFVGLGLLLVSVGTHLHIMHLNILDMRDDDGPQ
jgi:hypothetical protein